MLSFSIKSKAYMGLFVLLTWTAFLSTTRSFRTVPLNGKGRIGATTTPENSLLSTSIKHAAVTRSHPTVRDAFFQHPFQPNQRKHTRPSTTRLFYGESRQVDSSLMFDTWEWCANLGAPAALVAAAVLATMMEGREDMAPKLSDSRRARIAKKIFRLLVMSSFGLEIVSIFVTTVTGTMLLSYGDQPSKIIPNLGVRYSSPMGLLRGQWEFEYLTGRIAFIQGLFHWLGSVVIEFCITKKDETFAARKMNQFTACGLATIMIGMLSFLNRHMTFYENYPDMLRKYCKLCFNKFIWPPKPLTLLMMPMMTMTLVFGFQAFFTSPELENDNDDDDDDDDE